jgi:hypothetical protein
MEHLTDELDRGRLVGVLLLKLHDKSKGAILKGSVGGPDDNCIPILKSCLVSDNAQVEE